MPTLVSQHQRRAGVDVAQRLMHSQILVDQDLQRLVGVLGKASLP